jgi:monothiol glutaredoxin
MGNSWALAEEYVSPVRMGCRGGWYTTDPLHCSDESELMDVNERIKAVLAEHPIVLFMKGTPEFPMCGFSSRAAQALKDANAEFHVVNVLADPEIRAALPHYANWPTFPQLFIQGELIGGCDIVEDLKASGELARMAHDVAGESHA